MVKNPYTCARNCWGELGCDTCTHFKSVVEKNNEVERAQELFKIWKTKRYETRKQDLQTR